MSDEAMDAEGKATSAGGPTLTRKMLIERVKSISSARPKDVRDVVEATLAVMGSAIMAGEILRLPPFGVGKPRKPKEGALPGSAMMLVKTTIAAPKAKTATGAKGPKAAGTEGGRVAGKGAGKGGKGKGAKAKGVETPAASE